MGDDNAGNVHLPKIPKVEQNHRVTVTAINPTTMDHYLTVEIYPDFMNPHGLVKRGVRININEFSKGCKILSDRCCYRLLTPLNTFKYAASLHKATEDFMKNGDGGDEARPVIQVCGPTPFKFNKRNYVAVSSKKEGLKVFKLLGSRRDKAPKSNENTPTQNTPNEVTFAPNKSTTSQVTTSPLEQMVRLDVTGPTAGCSKTNTEEGRLPVELGDKTQLSAIPGGDPGGIGSKSQSVTESAVEVDQDTIPFVVNWSEPEVRPMEVNDKECLYSMVKIIDALDWLKPTVPGLGVCLLSEYGRFLLYNILVDDEPEEFKTDSDDEDEDDAAPKDYGEEEEEELVGYKQMLLVLHSNGIDTGKSTCSDICLRIFHGFKKSLQGTISFDSAKGFLEKGFPIVIDDYNNDDVGKVLVSRISKSVWGKAEINLKQQTYVPLSSLMFSTNEDINALKVEGKNKDEIFRKLSVIDLGEDTMNTQIENRNEKFKEISDHSRNIRKYLPSFYGISLGIHGKFISPREFLLYEDITKYERLANLLHNATKLHAVLVSFCESENLEKPRSLQESLSTQCLTNKSELAHKIRNPDQVVHILIKTESLLVSTTHNDERGLAFQAKAIKNYPWCKNTLQLKKNGVSVFSNFRSRLLGDNKKEARGFFIPYEKLKEGTIEEVKSYLQVDDLEGDDEEVEMEVDQDPADALAIIFKKEFDMRENMRKQEFVYAKETIRKLLNSVNSVKQSFPCAQCSKVCKSTSGLTKHVKTHQNPKKK